MDRQGMQAALEALDGVLPEEIQLLVGGGAAFLLAHGIPLQTLDIDAVPFRSRFKPADLDPYVKQVAIAERLPPDWLNPYFGTFTYSLPKDYGKRLVKIFTGKKMTAWALGKEDLLIMKCFAGREKDIPHALALLKKRTNTRIVADHLHHCLEENLPNAQRACDFFYDACEQLGIAV